MQNKTIDNSGSPHPGDYRPGKDGKLPEIYTGGTAGWQQTATPGTAVSNEKWEQLVVENYQGGTLLVWGINLDKKEVPHAY